MALRTYQLNLETRTPSEADELRQLLYSYAGKLNEIIQDTWRTLQWKQREVKGKKQVRLIPIQTGGGASRREQRDNYLEGGGTLPTGWTQRSRRRAA